MRKRIIAVLSLLLPLLPMAANAQFYQLKTYGVQGEDLILMVEADLNHDGKPDAVGLSFNGSQAFVTATLGDGKGGFLPPKTTQVTNLNNVLNDLAVGDFNNDGFPDVVFSGSDPVTGAPAVGVMLGKGDGTFKPTAIFDASKPGYYIVTGDFNGDQKIDIAMVDTSGDITVLPGKGNGTFGPAITTSMGVDSRCLAAADFNKDGHLDLTVGTYIFLGKGNGKFENSITVPDGSCGVAVADLNHDGIPDLVTGNSTSDTESIRVHLGDGTGKFTAGTRYHSGGRTAGAAIQVADLNGDGAPDLIVFNGGDSDFTIFLNRGSGTFKIGNTYNGGPNPFSFFVADLNQDNKADLAVTALGGVGVIPGNGDGTLQAEIAQSGLPTFIAADVNNDQKVDLVSSSAVQLGNGDGTFQPPILFPGGCNATTVGDFNGDGKLDIAGPQSGFEATGVVVCLGNGDGTFGGPVVYDQNIQHQLVLAGDFNHDGKLDLAASDEGGISILLGKGDGTFKAGIPTALNASFPTFVLGDFNNDGNLDIAANTNGDIAVLFGKGNGKFSAPVDTSIPDGLIYVGDMNKDGKLDLVVLNHVTESVVNVWLGRGDGTFTESSSTKIPGLPNAAVLGDFNLDGNLDVAVAAGPASMSLFSGDGKGGLKLKNYLSGLGIYGIASADFNGDQRLDIVTTAHNFGRTRLVVFLNTLK